MSEDRVAQLVALVIAEAIVAVGWLAILAVCVWLVNRRVRSVAAPDSKMEPWGWIVAVACFFFWPAAILLGIVFLRDPKMARVGRACVFAGLAMFSFAVVVAEILTAVLFVYFPEYAPR